MRQEERWACFESPSPALLPRPSNQRSEVAWGCRATSSWPTRPGSSRDMDVLITLGFTREMAAAAKRLKLVQVPGAGLDRIDRAALPAGALLANVYGHEIGIAEYVLGAMLTLTRGFARLAAALRRGAGGRQAAVGSSPPAPWP